MSMYLEFYPHSWYFEFAIKKEADYNDPCEIIDRDEDAYCRVHGKETGRYDLWCAGFRPKWSAFTEDGNTYSIVEIHATSLAQLNYRIVDHWLTSRHIPAYYHKKLLKARERYEKTK
jgi:hypothetical protein